MGAEAATVVKKRERIVVKLGTRVVLHQSGQANGTVLFPLAQQISQLRSEGTQVVIVSSGAVGCGRAILARSNKGRGGVDETLAHKQALAALGQPELMQVWCNLFSYFGAPVAQVLLTRDDLRSRERYLNASHTVRTLLEVGIIPIINENDSVATSEIKFGDNDILACLVGGLVDTDVVYNLTQAPGLLKGLESSEVVEEVSAIDEEILGFIGSQTSAGGTGGMNSKIEAAKVSMELGFPLVIASAKEPAVLLRLQAGERLGTTFIPQRGRLASRKRWLAASAASRGLVEIDKGAQLAIRERGKSLLPIGITRVEGSFKSGDLVTIVSPDGQEIGRGLINFSSAEIALYIGQEKQDKSLGEAIHRNHLFIRRG